MSDAIGNIVDKKLHVYAGVAMAVAAVLSGYYLLYSRVEVQATEIANLKTQYNQERELVLKYQDLTNSIDKRLAGIEGSLKIKYNSNEQSSAQGAQSVAASR